MNLSLKKINWKKVGNLLPVIVQDYYSHQVLMLGYMNQSAFTQTMTTRQLTFYSRSKQRLWVKGETSGNFLKMIEIQQDCDGDTLLAKVVTEGKPTCHLGGTSCFEMHAYANLAILSQLETLIQQRDRERPDNSYVSKLLASGKPRIAQKVGEEGVEVALALVCANNKELIAEAADLIFHLLILLVAGEVSVSQVANELKARMQHLENKI